MSYFKENLILKFKDEDILHIFSEGDGNNLHDEDVEEGYIDYIYEEQDNILTKAINEDGGEWLLEELYSEMFKNEEDLVKYVVEEVYHSNLEDVIVLSKEDYKQFMGFDYSDRWDVAMEQYENLRLLNKLKDMDLNKVIDNTPISKLSTLFNWNSWNKLEKTFMFKELQELNEERLSNNTCESLVNLINEIWKKDSGDMSRLDMCVRVGTALAHEVVTIDDLLNCKDNETFLACIYSEKYWEELSSSDNEQQVDDDLQTI